jgi:hypothetical protein
MGAPSLRPDVVLCEPSPIEGEVVADVVVAAAVEGGCWTLAFPFDVAGLRARSRREPSRSACSGPQGRLPGDAVSRRHIPKTDGRLRPLGVAALEDKIIQRAGVGVLNATYEQDFLGFSYGFRPGRRCTTRWTRLRPPSSGGR